MSNLLPSINDLTIKFKHNGSRMHKFIVPFAIDKDTAIELQIQAGYHPAGYGFYSFDSTITETTWLCGDSCD